jgi:hypothetical protein
MKNYSNLINIISKLIYLKGKNMAKNVLLCLVGDRKESAVQVQKVLTGWGCNIKTRLGIHDGVLDNCSEEGLIILELVGKAVDNDELCRKLNLIEKVKAKLIDLTLDN